MLIFSNAGCESSVHRDLESLREAWHSYVGKDDVTGVIHVGFNRPETQAFAECVKQYPGRMVLTASARWSLISICKCAPMIVGEAEAIPLFVALNGWGYEASAEEMQLGDSIQEPLKGTAISDEKGQSFLSVTLGDLGLQARTLNSLSNIGHEVVDDIKHLDRKQLLDIPNFGVTSLLDMSERLKPVSSSISSHSLAVIDDGITNSSLKLGSQFNSLDSLVATISAAVNYLPSKIEKVMRARMGLDANPKTLEEVGRIMGLTRERVRQIESNGLYKIGRDAVWSEVLEIKLAKLLDGREDPLPLSGLSILDDWFIGIEKFPAPFKYLLRQTNIIDNRFSVLKINEELFVSRLSQQEWDNASMHAMQLLEVGVNRQWNMSEARRRIGDLISDKGGELRSELWFVAKRFANFSSPHVDMEPILLSYGRDTVALVEAILSESDRPLHYSEIPHRIVERYGKEVDVRRAHSAALQVAILYGRGLYGLIKHCLLAYEEREIICEETLAIIINGSSTRQWSCAELIDTLNERDLNFDERLNKHTLNIALRGSSEIKYLGRFLWAQSAAASSAGATRIDIRQAVTSLLIQAGRPLTRPEIKDALKKDRGINDTLKIHSGGSIISVGEGLWGLIERDLPLSLADHEQLIAVLQKLLREKNAGIHVDEIMPCLESVFEQASRINDPNLIFAVAQRSGVMRKSIGGYLYLPEWDGPRRLNPSQAILEAFKQSSVYGVTANQVLKSASIILGREISRLSSYSYLSSIARFDEVKKLWVLSDSVDELDGE